MRRGACFIIIVCILFLGCKNQDQEKSLGLIETPEKLFKSFRAASPQGNTGAPPELAGDVDLSPYFPRPGDQGQIGSCTAWATAYACKSFHENIERNWGTTTQDHLFSPSYIYNQINDGIDQGSALEDAAALVIAKGCASFKTMPYTENFTKQPDITAHNEAVNFKALSFATVNYEDIDEVKRILSEGHPIIIGIDTYDNFMYYTGGVFTEGTGAYYGGHAMCVVGYDDEKSAIKVINSWGTSWGEEGYCWLGYTFMKEHTLTAIVLYDEVIYNPEQAAVPVNVEVSQGSYPTSISVTWEKAKNALSYRVYRSDKPDEYFSKIASTKGTTYIDTNAVIPGNIYYYAIRSIGISGESDFSESAKGYAGIIDEEPGIPRNLAGLFDKDTIYLSWDKVEEVTGYYVYSFNNEKENYLRTGSTTNTYFRDKRNFVNGEVIWFIVTAYKGEKESKPSQAFSITISLPEEKVPVLAKPKKVTASQGEYEDRIMLSWNSVDEAETYIVHKWKEEKAEWSKATSTSLLSYEDKEVVPPRAYYRVTAQKGKIMSEASDSALGYIKEHEIEIIDDDIVYDDTDYYDERELEDTNYTEEDLYTDDEEYKDKEIVYDDTPKDKDKKKDRDKEKDKDIPKEKEKDKKKDIVTEDQALDKVRDKIKENEKEKKEQKEKSKGKDDEKKEKLKERTKDLVEEGFDDKEFFGDDDDFFGDDDDF